MSLETITLDVAGMKCAGCVKVVERNLLSNPGVISACVNLVTQVAVVEYEVGTIRPTILAEKLTTAGFPSVSRCSNLGTSVQHKGINKKSKLQFGA
jgi:P-type Cu2+ transporter